MKSFPTDIKSNIGHAFFGTPGRWRIPLKNVSIMGSFYRNSLRTQKLQMSAALAFEIILVSNLMPLLFSNKEGHEFGFMHHRTAKDHGKELKSKLAVSFSRIVHCEFQTQNG